MDQALALTPGVPEGLRESIVERVEEGSREYVQKATDPRNQALWRENAVRAGSSAWKIARGGGGTSRASHSTSSAGTVHEETGEFTLLRRDENPSSTAATSSSSVHSFFAAPNMNVTTVVTVTFLEGSEKVTGSERAFERDLPSSLEQSIPGLTSRPSSARAGSSNPSQHSMPLPSMHDPTFVSGRDW